ncbi:MAG: hypothetical protein NTV09_11190 [Bacteroidetes bacterium]|nr:hypothetical protein [Bacteroidota bacterium]
MKIKNLFPMMMLGAALVSMTLGTGCKKEKESSDENFSAEAQDIGQSEDISTSVDNVVAEAFNSKSGNVNGRYYNPSNSELSDCATVTWDSAHSTATIYFNHCASPNGHTRDGYIIVTYSGGDYWTMGASWDVTFDNFFIDDRQVTGTRHVENVGPESNGCVWNISANLTFTRSDGTTRTWSSTRTREITQGYRDTVCSNHIYKINGTASHADTQSGNSANLTFTNIIRDLSCAYITAGTINIVPNNGRPERSIDFGTGACDDIATVTKNGVSKVIHLDGGRH